MIMQLLDTLLVSLGYECGDEGLIVLLGPEDLGCCLVYQLFYLLLDVSEDYAILRHYFSFYIILFQI